MREKFEKLPEIAKVLRVFDVIFDGENYSAKGNHSEVKKVYALGFVNGAWYAYQEQQKKIDEIVGIVREADLSDGNSSVAILYDEIKELLK